MNISQLTKAIKYLPTRKSILLKGTHGIGKTEWVSSMAEKLGLKLVIWHASHAADAGDITGLPFRITETDPETGKTYEVTRFAKPQWMIQNQPVLLLLDEINRGLSIALNAIMQLTNNGTYDDISLPEGSRIFACINPEEDGKYDVGTMDAAQLDRFAIYDFLPTVEEWLEWAVKKGLDFRVTGYIQSHPTNLDPYTNQELVKSVQGKDCGVLPSRRCWEQVSDTIKNGDVDKAWEGTEGTKLLTEIVAGLVGSGAALDFISYFKAQGNALSPKMLMEADKIDATLKTKLAKLCKTDFPSAIKLVGGCTLWMKEHEKDIPGELGARMAHNFYDVLESLTKDAQISAVKDCVIDAVKKQEAWAIGISKHESRLKALYKSAMISRDL
jgi:MoxR-like ATPases